MAKIAVIGTGYVGLTTSIGFASLGHTVTGFDKNETKIDSLLSRNLPIYEPGLQEIMIELVEQGNLKFTKILNDAVADSEFVFICVPTPQDEDGSADLSYVLEAASSISPLVRPNTVIVTKSTVPVGSAKRIVQTIGRDDIFIASNPEFLREGQAVRDFNNPDRIVIGANQLEVGQLIADLYSQINSPIVICSPESAELIKYASNSFLALKLSFVNDIAALCEASNANVEDVVAGMGLDNRIGSQFLNPGPGWGGSCFPKDTRALRSIADTFGMNFQLISAAIESNERAHKRVVDNVMHTLGGSLDGKTVAVWGLAFKANTDDTRESPSLAIIERLIGRGAKVQAYDPIARVKDSENFAQKSTPVDAARNADALVVLTEWPEFSDVDPNEIRNVISNRHVFDTRNILNFDAWLGAGISLHRLGHANV